jgi:hypothetical protein
MIVTPRNQAPLPLELRPEKPARLSQTWLSNYLRCKHSAYLYTKYRGATASHAMDRGSLFHETVSRLTNDALDHGWTSIPTEVAKACLFEVYAEGNYTVPAEEWDFLRRCVHNWAENTVLEPDKILGVEQLAVMDIGDWRISGKLDLCWSNETTVGIRDYKTSPHPLTKEEYEQSFQAKCYSLLLAYGYPVTVSDCECQGTGQLLVDMGDQIVPCSFCGGKGYTETVEPYPLGQGAQHFDIAEVYPALVFDDGGLMERRRVLSRAELLDERSMLEALLAQVSKSFDEGHWPAVPSDDACGKCPARRDCPLPKTLLPFDGIDTPEEAEHFAMAADLLDLERKSIQKALKAWVKNKDGGAPRPIPLGNGLQLAFVKQEVNETDYEGFKGAQAAGKMVDLDDFRSKRIQTSFKPEPIPQREPTPDEKWGDTMPGDSDLSEEQSAA